MGYFADTEQSDFFFKYRSGVLKAIYVVPGDKVKKGDILAELDNTNASSQVRQLEFSLSKAQLSYNETKASGGNEYALQRAALDLQLAQLKLEEARQDIEKSRLVSTVDGIIDYVEDVKNGEMIDANRVLVRITDPERLRFIYKGERLSSFQEGMEVEIYSG